MYSKEVSKIREGIIHGNHDVVNIDGENRLQYLQFISTLKIYFPKFNNISPYDFFINVKLNQSLAKYDLYHYKNIESTVNIISSDSKFISPKIYCSFHYGSYRILNCILHEKNIDFAVVANQSILNSSKEELLNLHENELSQSNRKVEFQLINANSNSGIIEMLRTLKHGKSLVIYIDGGNGVGGFNKDSKNATTITFLNKIIYSRTGAAFLSARLNIPIIPVIARRVNNFSENEVKFYAPIIPLNNSIEAINKVTQQIWNIFEKQIIKDPKQWDGMLYANNFVVNTELPFSSKNENCSYCFNIQGVAFFTLLNINYLYSYETFESFKLTKKIFTFLQLIKDNATTYSYTELLTLVHTEVLNDLITKQILLKHYATT